MTRALFLALLAFVLPGCTHRLVVSQPLEQPVESRTAERGGLVYALPMTLVSVSGAQDTAGNVVYTVTPSLVPDPQARYRLKYGASGYTDDDLKLEVDKNGLLTSTKANSTDRTGDIIVAIAKTAAAVGYAPSAVGTRRTNAYPFSVVYTLEEFFKSDRIALPDGAHLELQKDWRPASFSAGPSCSFSVCFRPVFPVRASITVADGRKQQFAFLAVDRSRTEGIDLRTASLVARQNLVSFDGGLVTGITVNQPSTTLAIVSLPLTVLKAILAVPAELLTLKVNNVQAQSSLEAAQASLLTQMKAVLDAQQALEKARAGANIPHPPITGAGSAPQ